MRKDWREAYYEEEQKPFDSRWPGGHVYRAEEKSVFGKNVSYPPDIDLNRLMDNSEGAVYQSLGLGVDIERVMDKDGFETNELVVNMGPHHPSTHGVFRMVLTVDGETVTSLEPVMGYLHRNHEKIGERNTYLHNIPFTDRLDYISSMGNNHGYVLAVEQLMSLGRKYNPPTYRCEALRVMMVELSRIVNHLWAIGFWLNDIGAFLHARAVFHPGARAYSGLFRGGRRQPHDVQLHALWRPVRRFARAHQERQQPDQRSRSRLQHDAVSDRDDQRAHPAHYRRT